MSHIPFQSSVHRAIMTVSHQQFYQKKVMLLCMLTFVLNSIPNLYNSSIFMNPLFKCEDQVVTEAYGCLHQCKVDNDYTATLAAGLICEERQTRMNIQASFGPGMILGLIGYSMLADKKGRKYSLLTSEYVMIGGQCLIFFGILNKNALLMAIGQFFCGSSCMFSLNVSFTIASELFSDTYRQKSVILYCSGMSIADICIMVLYYVIPAWWFTVLFMGLLPTLAITIYLQVYLVESPQFLIAVNKDTDSALASIEVIGKANHADPSKLEKAKQMIRSCADNLFTTKSLENEEHHTDNGNAFKQIVQNKQTFKTVVCLMMIKLGFYSFYYGALGCLERTGFNAGISIFLIGISQLVGYLSNNLFIDRFKRKNLLVISNLVKSIIGLSLVSSAVSGSPILSSIVLIITFFAGTCNYSAIAMLETQSFPLNVQSTANGLTFAAAFTCRIFLPYLIGFMNEHGVHPLFACSALLLLLGITPAFFIQETWGKKAAAQEHRSTIHSVQDLKYMNLYHQREEVLQTLKPEE